MEHKPNTTCRVCGKPYYACKQCARKLKSKYGVDSWRSVADSPTHYQVYITCVLYGRDPSQIDEYRSNLQNLNLSREDIDSYLPGYRRMVYEILGLTEEETPAEIEAEPESVPHPEPVEEPTPVEVEDAIVLETASEAQHDNEVQNAPRDRFERFQRRKGKHTR